ncbi:subtilisin-like protein [Cucurbitaria berberidis CBS 394.84]|uniref:Subtilisin-like protein n=1 Tax=Cucurbitaria berberidis CBS 394.84 TaxID=1168544 RepID=A0A9P4GGS4_9PLEO|nr:subtilisin-like protein [Cucurbitaria berberidis CBS 394.84]KAF1845067.1 subtilisin-like protein [Cucurbitaria berberidis CBS 394.84]
MYISPLLAFIPVALAAPLVNVKRDDIIAGKYIVKLKGDVSTFAEDQLKKSISTAPDFEYTLPGFRGWAGTLSDREVTQLKASSQVEYIEQDAKVYASAIIEQQNATWGLGRISHREKGSTTYVYDDTAGEGTCSYIIDTGIFVDHPQFEGRAEFLTDASGEGTLADGNGHGTHVAGTIGSAEYGVSKKTKLFAVKVLTSSGSGSFSGVIAGINFVQNDARSRKASGACPKGVVSNMSLGGGKSVAINEASAALVASGVFLAVAAGNSGDDAQFYSPASEPTVCTVGATTIDDKFINWSNRGTLVDILAPGVNITSTWRDGGINTISGTSMASPHIAGLGAYLLGLGGADVNTLCQKITELATPNAIDPATLPAGTVNLLAYNGAK